jgi:hypothetical protein
VLALTIGLLAIYGRDREPAVRLVKWIRGLPGGGLIVLPGSGKALDHGCSSELDP